MLATVSHPNVTMCNRGSVESATRCRWDVCTRRILLDGDELCGVGARLGALTAATVDPVDASVCGSFELRRRVPLTGNGPDWSRLGTRSSTPCRSNNVRLQYLGRSFRTSDVGFTSPIGHR